MVVLAPLYMFGTLGTMPGIRDCAWGCVRPVCGGWVSRVVPLVMFSAPLGRGRGERDCVQGCVRPVCGVVSGPSAGDRWRVWRPCLCFRHPWEKPECSKLCAGLYRGIGGACGDPAYVFAAFFTMPGHSRLRVGLCDARLRGVGGACSNPPYVFGTLGTKTGRVRLRVGLSEACVRGVGVRVGTLIVLLHDLRACHRAYASGLVSQRVGKEGPVPQLSGAKLPLPCTPPGQLRLWSSVWVLFVYSLPTLPINSTSNRVLRGVLQLSSEVAGCFFYLLND